MTAKKILSFIARAARWRRQPFAFDGHKGRILSVFSTFDPYRCAARCWNQIDPAASNGFIWLFGAKLKKVPSRRHPSRTVHVRTKLRSENSFGRLSRSTWIISPFWQLARDKSQQRQAPRIRQMDRMIQSARPHSKLVLIGQQIQKPCARRSVRTSSASRNAIDRSQNRSRSGFSKKTKFPS